MFSTRSKSIYFLLEGLNAFATGYYGNYVYFLFRDEYGFTNLGNLTASALSGFVFIFAAWQGGRFAQRYGYFNALRVGWGGMATAIAIGLFAHYVPVQLAVLLAWTICMCFTWPTLEALASEGETDRSLPQQIGFYNVVWSGGSALSYFCGGAIFEHLGRASLFWLPLIIHLGQLSILQWHSTRVKPPVVQPTHVDVGQEPEASASHQPVRPKTFLWMAWLANPFAYIGINTLLATVPTLALKLHFSPTQMGLLCSIWFFARWFTFGAL
jgi:hypothetical protein